MLLSIAILIGWLYDRMALKRLHRYQLEETECHWRELLKNTYRRIGWLK